MKKLFTLLAFAMVLSLSTRAQLADNSIAPDWTLRDINGTTHNLYWYLDQGYTVYMDVSAAWCGPCWSYHNTHALRDLYEQHGPSGYPSVVSTTTDDVMVFFIEGEGTNTLAQLNGTSSGTARSTFSQGNWVAGTTYPIIDTTVLNTPYNIRYFPTVYKICPNRLITEVGGQTATNLYAMVASCPPAATLSNDPLMVSYTGANLSLCGSLAVSGLIQNHGTSTLTSATIKAYQGATEIGSYNWSGSLASYQTATVSLGTLTVVPGAGALTLRITSTNDDLTNDQTNITAQVLSVIAAPATNTTESSPNINTPPTGAYATDGATMSLYYIRASDFSTAPPIPLGAYGASDVSMLFDFYDGSSGTTAGVVFDKVTIPSFTGGEQIRMEFDYAYAPYPALEADLLEVGFSKDCGTSWVNKFSKSGATLATTDTVRGFYAPRAASEWKTERMVLNSDVVAGDEIIMRVKGTSAYGNNAYVDNVKLYKVDATGIKEIITDASVTVFPNPSAEILNVGFATDKDQEITITLTDTKGQVVYSATEMYNNGTHNATINVQNVANGSYILSIGTKTTITSKNVQVSH